MAPTTSVFLLESEVLKTGNQGKKKKKKDVNLEKIYPSIYIGNYLTQDWKKTLGNLKSTAPKKKKGRGNTQQRLEDCFLEKKTSDMASKLQN